MEENCLTSDGAYAVYAGSQEVDVSTVLFPLWGCTAASVSEAMLKSTEVLEREYCLIDLYRYYLVEFDSAKEGVL